MQPAQSRWRFPTCLVVLALLTAACSGSDAEDTTTSTTVEAPQATAATTTAAATTTTTLPERFKGQLAGLTVIDESTFTVQLADPDPEFPLRLADHFWFALPDAALADPAAQNEMPIGNGPFMMDGPWEHDVRIRAVRNPDYRGPDPAKVDVYEWVMRLNDNAAYNETLAGNLDIMHRIPADFVESAEDDFGANYGETDSTGLQYIGIPAYLPQYTKEHRQALSMAIDRDLLIQEAFAGSGMPARAVVPPSLGGRAEVCDNWSYDPAKAKDLWQAAGGLDEITFWVNTGGGHERWVQAVVEMWSETLDIDPATVSYEAHDFDVWGSTLAAGEATGPFRLGLGMNYPSPLDFLEPVYASYSLPEDAGYNVTYYRNPAFDAALAAGKAKVAASGRLDDGRADYEAAEDILCEDVPAIPIRFGINQYVHSDNVSNVYLDAFGQVGYTVVEAESGTVRTYLREPDSLLSPEIFESEGAAVVRALNTGLIQFDPRTNQPFNAHARSITSDDGGTTWTVVLNPGWTFHDGTPNDAASYVKAWSYGATTDNLVYGNIVGYDELNPDTGED